MENFTPFYQNDRIYFFKLDETEKEFIKMFCKNFNKKLKIKFPIKFALNFRYIEEINKYYISIFSMNFIDFSSNTFYYQLDVTLKFENEYDILLGKRVRLKGKRESHFLYKNFQLKDIRLPLLSTIFPDYLKSLKKENPIMNEIIEDFKNGKESLNVPFDFKLLKEVRNKKELYDEIFIKEILKRENSNGIKRHKVLKYSQADLNTREILKEFFKNKTSNQILKNVYPNFDEWFDKVLKEIEEDNTKREILFFGNINSNGFQIEGIAILKNTEEEKKICYLYISFSEDVDNVFEEIYNYLGTETPLITLEKEIFEDKYKNYLVTSKKERKLKFKLTSIVPNKYVKGKTELIFNEVGENLKKNEEIVETMNEETKEDIKN